MGNNQPKAPNKTNTSTKTPTKTNNTVFSPIPLKVLTESDHSSTKDTVTRDQKNK